MDWDRLNRLAARGLVFTSGIGVMGVLACAVIVLMTACTPAFAASIPATAWQYQRDLTRAAQYSYGINAPTATLAGLIHQESRWRADAVSPVGAQGIAQFMPRTADWMPEIYPVLGEAAPHDPRWSIRAAVLYTEWLHVRIQAADPCESWAFVLSAFNGGLTWVNRDKRLASDSGSDPLAWFDSVERYNAGRSAANFAENRHYPQIILTRWTPMYHRAGWGAGACRERWYLTETKKMKNLQIENEIRTKGLVAPRITPADIEANIVGEHYFTAADGRNGAIASGAYVGRENPEAGDQDLQSLALLTFCVLVLRNGYSVTGESACASPENFDAEIGRKVAHQNALEKIWPLMGYELRSKLAERA